MTTGGLAVLFSVVELAAILTMCTIVVLRRRR